MYIMSAGMHDTLILRFINNIIFLFYRKCIHIGTQCSDPGIRIFSFDQTDHAGSCPDIKWDPKFFQFSTDKLRCFKFLVAQFRMGMQMMSYPDKLSSVSVG